MRWRAILCPDFEYVGPPRYTVAGQRFAAVVSDQRGNRSRHAIEITASGAVVNYAEAITIFLK